MSSIDFDAAVDRDAANHPPHPTATYARWADGTCCDVEDLPEYLTFMSDDYEVL